MKLIANRPCIQRKKGMRNLECGRRRIALLSPGFIINRCGITVCAFIYYNYCTFSVEITKVFPPIRALMRFFLCMTKRDKYNS